MKTMAMVAVVMVVCASGVAWAMAQQGHMYGVNELGGAKDLIGVPAGQGGAGNMTQEKMESIHAWMDNPARKTGQYRNHKAGGALVHPSNHGNLRHNPSAVARVWSGNGTEDLAVKNVARLHKIQDMYHNSAPVDGWRPTAELKNEAKDLLLDVGHYKKLPERLPPWVDMQGKLITGKEAQKPLMSAGKAVSKGKGATVTRGLGRAAVVVGVGVEACATVKRIQATEEAYAEGLLSAQERGVRHAEAVGGAIGGTIGGYAGATVGAVGGAAAGSFAGPAGTAGGGVGGGIAGGMAGGYLGDAIGRMLGRSTIGRALGTIYVMEEDAVAEANIAYLEVTGKVTLPAEEYEGLGLGRAELRAIHRAVSSENDIADVE